MVYEDISHDPNEETLSRDNVGPTSTQSGQTNQTKYDYVNTPHPAEVDQEKVNDYDRVDVRRYYCVFSLLWSLLLSRC